MKVCWFGAYDPDYSRNKILIDGLRLNGVEVIECNFKGKGLRKYFNLIRSLRSQKNDFDFLYCAFPVHTNIILAYFFQSNPVVVDAFFPKYDSVVNDRRTQNKFHPRAWAFYILDRLMVLLSDLVIVDTVAHKDFFSRWCNKSKIFVLPVGVHSSEFYPKVVRKFKKNFLVQFHGSYIPLQGIDHIIETAKILSNNEKILFRLIGSGQEFNRMRNMAEELKVKIEFVPWLSIEELNDKINEADIILGIFGDTPKTNRVIPNKLYQGLAVRKPVITKDTPAVREEFNEGELMLVSNQPCEIAQAILTLYGDVKLREELACKGYNKVSVQFNEKSLGKELCNLLTNYHVNR